MLSPRAHSPSAQNICLMDFSGFGAWVFFQLGQLGEAKELAEDALLHHPKTTTRWQAHVVLAKIAAAAAERENIMAEEEKHLEAAIEVARTGGMLGLQLLGLQTLRARVLGPQGRQAEGTKRLEEAAQSEGFGNQRKTLADFGPLLEGDPL